MLFILFILISIFLTSSATAIFGCAPTQDPNKYAHLWKDEIGTFHLIFCFTPRENVQNHLSTYGLTYDEGELRGAFNVKYDQQQQKYEAYVGQTPLSSVIAALQYEETFIEERDVDQGDRIAAMLGNLASFMVEDKITQINYLSTSIFFDKNGIISNGKISVPRYKEEKDNVMYAGSIISTYYYGGFQRPYTQPELQISGITLEFSKPDERKLTWSEANAYLIKSDQSGKQMLSQYTANVGTIAKYISKEKTLKVEKGKLYKDGQELRNAIVKLVTQGETLICCSTDPSYCISAESKNYPLKALSTACSFGIGNFDIKHNAEKGETIIKAKAFEIVYTTDKDRILELIKV